MWLNLENGSFHNHVAAQNSQQIRHLPRGFPAINISEIIANPNGLIRLIIVSENVRIFENFALQ
jgi:hypothetical protein